MQISINRSLDGEFVNGVFEPGKKLPWIDKKVVAVHVVIDDRIGVQYQIEGECVTQTKEQLLERMNQAGRNPGLDEGRIF